MIGITFGGATPILRVRDLAASVTYYTTVLGFQEDWQGPGLFASVSRDRCILFLCEGDQGNPGAWACEIQATEPKPGQPIGPWRDMHGVLWERSPTGDWAQAESG